MSDEYTPTTDEVWERFSLVQCGGAYGPHEMRPAVKYRERFERWLAAHDESVRAEERERIVRAVEVAQWFVFEDEDVEPDAEFVRRADVDRIARGEG